MVVQVNEQELSLLVERLDKVQIEVFKLRAQLLSEEQLSPEELKELDLSLREVAKGKFRKLDVFPDMICGSASYTSNCFDTFIIPSSEGSIV